MTRALAVFVALGVLQASWGSAFSAILDPNVPAASPATVESTLDEEANQYCHSCIKIDEFCYNHTFLLKLDAPFGEYPIVTKMGIMTTNNILYYTFLPKINDLEYSKAAYVSLDSPKYSGVISGWQQFNFRTFDINQKEKKVYLGGSDGIWFVNSTSPVPRFASVKGKTITNVVSKSFLYFTERSTPGIIENVNGYFTAILDDETINNFVLDKTVEYNIVFLNDTGLYIWFSSKTQSHTVVRLSTERYIRGLTVDARGTVYAWHLDGIYKVFLGKVPSDATLKRVSGIIPDAMAFDKDNNIVYAMRKRLFKLTKVLTRICNSA